MKRKMLISLLLALTLIFLGAGATAFAAPAIVDFELEIDLKDGNKYDLEYEVKGNTLEAKYQVPGEPVVYGQDASTKVHEFMNKLALTPTSNHDEVIEKVLSELGISRSNVKEFELEVDFDNGQELDIEFER